MERYLVESPEVLIRGGWDEPPEYGRYVVWVQARNKRDAINKAIATPEFRDWTYEARGDGRPPQAQLFAISESELDRLYAE